MKITSDTPRTRRKGVLKKLLAIAGVAAVALTGAVAINTQPAEAATAGPGYGTWDDTIGWQGAFRAPDGSLVYCIEPGVSNPSGTTTDGGYDASVTSNSPFGTRTLTADDLARINYIVTAYGQGSPSNREASAVAFAVKVIANPNAMYNSHGYTGSHTLAGYVNWVLNSTVGGAEAAAVAARAQAIVNAAMTVTAGPTTGGSGSLVFTVDSNNYNGTVVMDGTPGSTGTITLTNGIFVATNSNTLVGATEGTAYQVRGVPPTDDGAPYKISGTGQFTAPGGGGYQGNVRIWNTSGQQKTAGPGLPAGSQFTASGNDPEVRSSQFLPVLTSRATAFHEIGDAFTDVLTFATTADDAGVTNDWYRTAAGDYTPVIAKGTLYGPFAAQPTQSATVPAGAPVAGHATVMTSLANGPTVNYTATSDTTATASGYYTWVWTIDWADQPATPTQFVIPGPSAANPDQEPYHFQDAFGQVVESSMVPMRPILTSQVEDSVVAPGAQVRDTLNISNSDGPWLQGTNAQFTGKVYAITDGTRPTTSNNVPAGLTPFATVSVTANGPGEYTSPAVTVPANAGYIVWVWEFNGATQAQPTRFATGYTWADDWALGDETSSVVFAPTLSTRVSSEFVKKGEDFNDIITSAVASGSWIDGVEVKAKGTLYGPFLSRPGQSAVAPAGAPVVGTTELTLDGVGNFETDSNFTSDETGYYTWVWEIHAEDQTPATRAAIPANYSFVDDFARVLETSITPSGIVAESRVTKDEVALGERVQDTLNVRMSDGGWIQADGGRVPVTFRGTAYFVPGTDAPAVSPTVPVDAEVLGTTTLTVQRPGEYTSEELPGEDHREGYITWVWEIREEDQPAQYRGYVEEWSDAFGLPSETQRVLVPEVATKAQTEAYVGTSFTDTATVTGVMPVDGADLHFELYAATRNAEGEWVCEAGNLLWTSSSTHIDETGEYTSEAAPGQFAGEYHWVEVLTSTDGNEIHRGECGIPDETTTVVAPKVTTKAQPGAKLNETIKDTAIIEGELPDNGAELTFEAYTVPMIEDVENPGTWVIDYPADVEAGDLSWVCTAENLAYDGSGEGQVVTEAGEYDSADVPATEYAKVLWVESLWSVPVGGEERQLIHKGDCGLTNETSYVLDVTTRAVADGSNIDAVENGMPVHDTVQLTGYVPEGGSVEVEVYLTDANAPAVCEKPVTTLPVATNLGGGLYTEAAPLLLRTTKPYIYDGNPAQTLYFVEVTKDSTGREVSRGDCGDVNETAGLKGAKGLAGTGGTVSVIALGAAGVLVLGGLAFSVMGIRRRKCERGDA